MKHLTFLMLLTIGSSTVWSHEGHPHESKQQNLGPEREAVSQAAVHHWVIQKDAETNRVPEAAVWFQPFRDKLGIRFDNDYLYIESDGLPDHSMMIGIRAWQQQVPLPQPYRGQNAWRLPLRPVPARQATSAKDNYFRGAIALAVNGVPIFNPIKNDGKTDTLVAGELDQWGGHCGRADDYHYHTAPVHLEKLVGKGQPIAVALDGYPIYGYTDSDGKLSGTLDRLNGHKNEQGDYHYHATKGYPYLNGGFHGRVTERGGQVDPQPRGQPIRPAGRPLRGALITGFERPAAGQFVLDYRLGSENHSIEYQLVGEESVRFRFVGQVVGQGKTHVETYSRGRQRGGGRGSEPSGRRPPPKPRPR